MKALPGARSARGAAARAAGAAAAALLLAGVCAARAAGADDAKMRQLAASSGCVACHTVEIHPAGAQGGKPIGPAWKDVAQHYRGQAGIEDKLIRTVLEGSNSYYAHWQGKVSGIAMPPNKVAITEADARQLVTWILQLK